jgi:hypothetical protein
MKKNKKISWIAEADYMTTSLRLQPKLANEYVDPRLSRYTLCSEGKVRRWTAEREEKRGGKTWSWKMIDRRRHSRYRGASTCIAAIVKSVWTMRRRWPLSGSTKPEILDVLGADAATQTATCRLILGRQTKKKEKICHDSLLWHRNSLGRLLRQRRPTFGHLYQNAGDRPFFSFCKGESFIKQKRSSSYNQGVVHFKIMSI